MNNIKYVGMDVHKSITVIVVLNELGQFESQSRIKTKGENICDFFRGISGKVEVLIGGFLPIVLQTYTPTHILNRSNQDWYTRFAIQK
jgi:hypothetical protein